MATAVISPVLHLLDRLVSDPRNRLFRDRAAVNFGEVSADLVGR